MKKRVTLMVYLLLIMWSFSASAQIVSIPDDNLRAAIEEFFHYPPDFPITKVDMEQWEEFYAEDADITDLTGLEHATNLTFLNLQLNNISDISPLMGLTKLTTLRLGSNAISDISPLTGLTNLTVLELSGNNILDISPLARLIDLEGLTLGDNAISNISPLAGLTNLTTLRFSSSSISDISALTGLTNLTGLDLSNNSVSDISPLTGLINLIWLNLRDNSVSDLSPLVDNTEFGEGDEVDVRGNPLSDESIQTHIPALLDRDVAVESDMLLGDPVTIPDDNLRAAIEIHLGKAGDASITTVDMKRLRQLSAPNFKITNLTGLEGATNLTILDLEGNFISDISRLAGLTKLEWLNLSNNSVSNISAVAGLTNLTWLNLSNNSVSNISAVAGLTNLTWLELSNNDLTDISAVVGLTNLTFLWLQNNSISDLSPLVENAKNAGLGSGDRVDVRRNPLSFSSIYTHIPALQNRGVTVHFDVYIRDDNLRAKIKDALGKASGDPITAADMANLTRLDAKNAGVTDLTGLEWAIKLTSLDLSDEYVEAERHWVNRNSVSDLSPLSGLTGLEELWLQRNDISDISALAELPKLRRLSLGTNNVTDISPLSGLTELEELWLQGNNVTDISPLAGLTNLRNLELNGNSISDLSALKDLTNLTGLHLRHNNISDLSPLVKNAENAGLGSGDTVYVTSNPLNRASIETHIPALQNRGVTVHFDVYIRDDNLRAKIKDALGKASGDPITAADMANLTRLDAKNAGISDLAGLEFATNLTYLDLGFVDAEGRWINSNSVSNLSPLVGLTQLTYLNLWGNSISDISPLAGLTNLTQLELSNNNISDISSVAGLTNLTYLDLDGNSISDLSGVSELTNLTRLEVGGNNVSDLSPLANLTNLTILWLYGNRISDLSPLVENAKNAGLGSGDTVYVTSNPLNRASIETHIPALQDKGVKVEFDNVITELVVIPDDNLHAKIADALGKASDAFITTTDMERLTELHARNADISNLAGLEAATNLTRLDLGTEYVEAEGRSINRNSVSDLSPLAGLTNLTWLRLRNNSISDISPLAGLTNLEWLNLGGNLMISDLSALSGLTNLTSLYLYGNSVSDISVLAGLTNLTFLNLWFSSVSDLSPLAGLTNLTWLGLYNNLVSDLSPLKGLTNLTYLTLANHSTFIPATGLTHLTSSNINNNAISDLSPLVDNTGLGAGDFVEVWGNPLSDASIQTHIPALQDRGVRVEFIQTPTFLLKISGTVTASDNLLIVEVRDNRDRLLAGVPVTFTVVSGGGTLSVTDAITDTNGRAESRLTLGPNTGTNTVRASVAEISEPVIFSDVPEPPVTIRDSNLRAAIGRELGKSSGDPITASDIARLRRLTARNADISYLTGLEGATNLTNLDLGSEWVEGSGPINSNSISDLSPLSGLTNLSNLTLDRNAITDISLLSGLTNLTWLWLRDNSISDISSLSGLTNLGGLNLAGNNISDILPLSGLTNLTFLGLNGNSVSDISPLAGLTNLTTLSLNSNSISDISPVGGLTNLTDVDLWGNTISDISAVAGLTNLEFLVLGDNSVSDISAVAGLTNLRFLILADNSIVDLLPLVKNTGLGEEDWVNVERNPLSDTSINTHIPELQNRGVEVYFDLPARPVKSTLSEHTSGVVSVAFSSRGMIASGSNDNTARLWNPVTESTTVLLRGHNSVVRSVAFSPDGSILATGSHDSTVILWDAATGQPKHTLTKHTAAVETVAFSRDGSTLASGSHDGMIILWEVANGQAEDTIMGQANRVWSLTFSPDGTLAIGRDDGTVLLWEVANRQPKDTLIGHTGFVESVAFSPDGSTLASGSVDTTVRLWEVATGGIIHTFTEHTEGVNSVAFSPEGTTLASGADDNTVRLWDVGTGHPIALLTGHTAFVRSVAFSPDGSTLASGSGDGTIRLWEIGPPILPEYTLSIPADINLIHVPLKVTAVDGAAKTIESVSDLYDALGGADTVTSLVTHDPHDLPTQKWRSYLAPSDKGKPADRTLTDDTGVIAVMKPMKTPVSLRLSGTALGTNGNSTITLSQGLNLVGIPLRDERLNRVSDLLRLDGIWGNVPVITVDDGGKFKVVRQVGDPGDIAITGGSAFILDARQPATITISGEAWTNVSETAAAPLVTLKGIEGRDATPVLVLRGSVVDEEAGLKVDGFRVTVKNLSTGRAVTGMTKDEGAKYRLTVVDIETAQAATIGDILEISAQSPNPFIGVEPLQYTVTAEDVKWSLIELPELAAYEIPAETELLANYPNPFNPETWIPYRLAEDAFVTLTIYDGTGHIVRTLDMGHQVAAVYESRSKAIYWDGRNGLGEQVASGVYFYHLSAGDYSATRKMVILK